VDTEESGNVHRQGACASAMDAGSPVALSWQQSRNRANTNDAPGLRGPPAAVQPRVTGRRKRPSLARRGASSEKATTV